MDKCDGCTWRDRYNTAVQRFDKAINKAMTITIISLCIAIISIILAALCLSETLRFISEFEYVEETLIEQDGNGQNVAVSVDGNKN